MQVRKEASELDIIIDIFICLCLSVRVADIAVYPAAGKDKNKLITNRAEWAGITVDKVNRAGINCCSLLLYDLHIKSSLNADKHAKPKLSLFNISITP